MTIQDLLRNEGQETGLPEISGEACVHALVEVSDCQACVDACPRRAWVLDDEQLGLDTEACDGCGLCVPACPRGAIDTGLKVEAVLFRGRRVALLACERAGVEGEGVVPCIHAVSRLHLLELYRQGVRGLLYTHADCSACERGGSGRSLPMTLGRLESMLSSRGLAPLKARAHSVREWQARRDVLLQKGQRNAGRDLSRRAFLRGAAGEALAQGLEITGISFPEPERRQVSLDEWLAPRGREALYPAVPRIEAAKCEACHACARICPERVIQLDEARNTYSIRPGLCTGCRLCEAVCEADAVLVEEWASARPLVELPLRRSRCRSCGAPAWQVAESAREEGGQCRICARTGHQRLLYQVLE